MSSTELVNQFNNIYDAVESYASSSAYADFLAHTAHDGQALFDYMEGHGLKPIYNAAGDFTGGYYSTQAANYGGAGASAGALAVNSNLQTGTASVGNTAGLDFAFGTEQTQGGEYKVALPREYSGGQQVPSGTSNFLFGKVLPAVAAASTGIALGKKIQAGLYNWDPDFFDSHGMEYFNPQKWGEMADQWETVPVVGGALAQGIRMLYGVKKDPTTNKPYMQPYLREDQLNYFAAYLASMGFFNEGGKELPSDITAIKRNGATLSDDAVNYINSNPFVHLPQEYYRDNKTLGTITTTGEYLGLTPRQQIGGLNAYTAGVKGTGAGTNRIEGYATDDTRLFGSTLRMNQQRVSVNGTEKTGFYGFFTSVYLTRPSGITEFSDMDSASETALMILDLFGIETPAVPGVDTQTGATVPNIDASTDYNQIINIINNTLPQMAENRVEIPYVDEDGNEQTITFYPVPMPEGVMPGEQPSPDPGPGPGPAPGPDPTPDPTPDPDPGPEPGPDPEPDPAEQPISDREDAQEDPIIDPETATDILLQTIIDILIRIEPTGMEDPETDPASETEPLNIDPNPPATGEGSTPAIIMPTGSASRLWSVYNPSQAQVDAFGAWLWSSNFIDQIKKLFFDPMQAIIGIHKVFATPVVSGQGTIACGYIDSQVPSNLVGSQYVTVSCGSVNLYEYFGNVFDYDDTDLLLYLPFIGFVQIDTDHAMRGTVTVTYRVDVYTGACLAEVAVVRDGGGGVIYTFSGDCSVHYPLSSGSYMGIVSGLISAAGGIIGGALTGNPLMIGAGVMAGATGSRAKVQHSGQITGNAGAMGCKKPYFVIERPQTAMTSYLDLQGGGINYRTNITDVSGYARFTDVKLTYTGNATEEEKEELKRLLESGVYI